MRRDISKAEVEKLFVGAIDGVIPGAERAQLENDAELKGDFEKYERAVKLLRESPREEAPEMLSSMVMRRVRRRRGTAKQVTTYADYRLPVEVIIPLLLAALVVVFLMVAAP